MEIMQCSTVVIVSVSALIIIIMVWDVTVVSTLAKSYVDRAATGVGR